MDHMQVSEEGSGIEQVDTIPSFSSGLDSLGPTEDCQDLD
jgi:hypothetical protein